MPEDLGYLSMNVHPTAMRPLLGLTVLVVEDSRFASEAVRLLCIRSGARIRRADSLTAAHRHLQLYRPSVVIADIGLPDGSGIDLIADLAKASKDDRPVIIATTGADGEDQQARALEAGADGFLPKPIDTVSAFQQAILEHLPKDMRPTGPRLLSDEVIQPDTLSLREDLSHLDELLKSEPESLGYVAPFLQGLARLAGDQALKTASDKLSDAFSKGADLKKPVAKIRDLIRERLAVKEPV
ncbi:response regulator [uncultured Litoreibacter sp.]|uniref:response regulator n=1 Tax=uncultured Litoreibacter sp. TaxID=1392394 RepID=UPI00260AD996|nr:response regulator [uncultured Litoreibacter sp.]